jgi:hypothetical protein
MNCAIHPEQSCTQACSGCGTLLCESCDVVYLGRHYCKGCIERSALRLPTRAPRVGSRISRLIDRLMSRWYSIPLLFMGLLLVAAGLLSTEALSNSPVSLFEYRNDANGMSVNSQSFHLGILMSRSGLSIMVQIGAAMLAAGSFLVAKRFSLRWLLLAVVGIALLSSYPFMRLDHNPYLTHNIHIIGAAAVSRDKLTELVAALEPRAAMATLPQGLLDELSLKPGDGIERADVSANGAQLNCVLQFRDTASADQRTALEQFYEAYAIYLICHQRQYAFHAHSVSWEKYKAAWEAEHPVGK